jgi:transglutaminase-like putative cysteine protease
MPRLVGFNGKVQHLPAPSPLETMQWMGKFIRDGQLDSRLRALAEKIVQGLLAHDYLSEYAAILNWIRTNIRYTRDPRTVEQIKRPGRIVETGNADCDDMSILSGTLAGILGGKVRLVAASFQGKGAKSLTHVWAEAFEPARGCWVVLDPVPGRKVGQMLKRIARTETLLVVE